MATEKEEGIDGKMKWSIADGRRDFPRLVKEANTKGMQLVFNRKYLVGAIIGREMVEKLTGRPGASRTKVSGKEAMAAIREWRASLSASELAVLEGNEFSLSLGTTENLRSPFDEDDKK